MGIKTLFVILSIFIGGFVLAEEPIKIQAVNLAPIETQSTELRVIELSPQNEVPVKVQATPVIINKPNPAQTPILPNKQNVMPQNEIKTGPQSYSQQQPASVIQNPLLNSKQSVNILTTPSDVNMENCSQMYSIPAEQLLILTLGAIEANSFEVIEIQSKGGFITFKAMDKEFLATVASIDNKTAMLRINPINGRYHFAPGIVIKIFEYINYKLNN